LSDETQRLLASRPRDEELVRLNRALLEEAPPDSRLAELLRRELDRVPDDVTPELTAGLIDVCLLGTVTIAVVYLTLRVANVPAGEWQVLPVAPLEGTGIVLTAGQAVTVAGDVSVSGTRSVARITT
jgi:hypothetical protein